MKVKYDSDNLPVCPDCNKSLEYDCDYPKYRDTETIGGNSIDYFICTDGCKERFEVINGEIYPFY